MWAPVRARQSATPGPEDLLNPLAPSGSPSRGTFVHPGGSAAVQLSAGPGTGSGDPTGDSRLPVGDARPPSPAADAGITRAHGPEIRFFRSLALLSSARGASSGIEAESSERAGAGGAAAAGRGETWREIGRGGRGGGRVAESAGLSGDLDLGGIAGARAGRAAGGRWCDLFCKWRRAREALRGAQAKQGKARGLGGGGKRGGTRVDRFEVGRGGRSEREGRVRTCSEGGGKEGRRARAPGQTGRLFLSST
ncbi:hypothetical protein Mp_3g00140 [Marchantia polymorpha subsp. ruderalis]|uniref:Uncharacterized protein n=2 Tax=Marchantia polymorpha TaxID=3197 RepID=A0AAF6AVS8_MARPO|nr:hypothetical protein MARPO_0284s0001 [Marchantia polymorpha]BBN03862.1 hypothetical protein Mp_3g00140 [Marchantia polymorpha subsp. ruderalis]|eukprot:PTQ26881.1 hypothetical protein MARPO_0284s0001 [Marchantia polymorpha]